MAERKRTRGNRITTDDVLRYFAGVLTLSEASDDESSASDSDASR